MLKKEKAKAKEDDMDDGLDGEHRGSIRLSRSQRSRYSRLCGCNRPGRQRTTSRRRVGRERI
jgi:hypothetical protein